MENQEYIDLFKEEAAEHLQSLESILLKMETEGGGEEYVKEAKRSAHTIKGSARLVGLEEIGAVAHRMEDVFKAMEEGKIKPERDVITALLKGLDTVKRMLEGDTSEYENTINTLSMLIADDQVQKSRGKSKRADKSTRRTPTEKVRADSTEEQAQKKKERELKREYFRVSSSKIEKLLNTASQLLLEKIAYEQAVEDLELIPQTFEQEALKRFPDADRRYVETLRRMLEEQIQERTSEIEKRLETLSSRVFEVQYQALSLKVVPFYVITDELRRYVRDTAASLDKTVVFHVRGEDVEIDRAVLEQLKPAIMHIINNSITHGVESVEERETAGKSPEGNVFLRIYPRGPRIVIEIEDDGRGIDVDKLKDRALEKGIIDDFRYESMSDEDALNLIFVHGLSTAEELSQISGRGVGMDVVRENLSRMGGNIKVESQRGKYTRFVLEVPQTSSVIKGLWVNIGGELFVVPVYFIHRVIRLKDYESFIEKDTRYVNVEGRFVEVIDPLLVFGWGEYDAPTKYGMVLRVPAGLFCVYIDDFMEEEDVLVRSPGPVLERNPYIAGVVVGGDGIPHVILDVFQLREARARTIKPRTEGFEFEKILAKRSLKILLVDDSVTTLRFEKDVLEDAGYTVVTSLDGEEAWDRFQQEEFDLVVTDIQMPRMNGLELTRRIKSHEKAVPVIVVSSLGTDEDVRKGMEAGADAYIVKKDFTPRSFLQKVRQMIGE